MRLLILVLIVVAGLWRIAAVDSKRSEHARFIREMKQPTAALQLPAAGGH